MQLKLHPRTQSTAIAHRHGRTAAGLVALAFLFSGVIFSATAAHAVNQKVDFLLSADIGPGLGLSSGETKLQPKVGVDLFSKDVRSGTGMVASFWSSRSGSKDYFPPVSAKWRIVEDGKETSYGIQVAQDGFDNTCHFFGYASDSPDSQIAVDPKKVPYSCSLDSLQFDPQTSSWTSIVHLNSVVWSSVAGSLSAEGSVGLDQGQQTSRNARFFVSDSLHKPTDPVANINPGQTTSWSAEMRNGEGATADDGARTDFSYRILDDGEPTKYYAKGFMQNVKSASHFNRDYKCDIYDGDPAAGGAVVEASPYACLFNATETAYTHPRLAVDFTVKAFKPLGPVVTSLASSITTTGSIGLDNGYLASPNSRFWVDGSPFKTGQPIENITPGGKTSWKAELREGEGAEDAGTRTDFSYRIIESGVPTEFYVKGFVQIGKVGGSYARSHECAIYSQNPEAGGTVTASSPYKCESNVPDDDFFGPGDGHFDPHFDTEFTIQTR